LDIDKIIVLSEHEFRVDYIFLKETMAKKEQRLRKRNNGSEKENKWFV